MSDSEVKIHVSADADLKGIEKAQSEIDRLHKMAKAYDAKGMTTAASSARADADLKGIEKTQAEIAKLHKAAKAYDAKGMTTAATSARADARPLEREVARFTKERAASERVAIKDRAQAEKAVTKEIEVQHALKKAHIPLTQRQMTQTLAVGREIASGANPAQSLSSILASAAVRSGNPIVMGALIATAVAVGVAGVRSDEEHKDKMQELEAGTRRANEKFQQGRNWGIAGSSAAFRSEALASEQDAANRINKRSEIAEKAKFRVLDPSTWEWGGLRKNEGHREQEVNETEIAADLARQASDKKLGQKRFMESEGGLELDSMRQHAKRSLEGSRAEYADQEIGKAFAKYKEAQASGANPETAKEMATLTYQNDIRDRQAQAGAGLVDARTGAGGSAAAASWAMQGTPNESVIKAGLDRVVAAIDTPPLVDHAK